MIPDPAANQPNVSAIAKAPILFGMSVSLILSFSAFGFREG